MKKWSNDEDVFFNFPEGGQNRCAACFLENHHLDKAAMNLMEEAPSHSVCAFCGERFDSERAEAGNDEVAVLSMM